MQTFLPYADFERSAWALDNVRRSNQINEAKVIYDVLVHGHIPWSHHPATRMWRRHAAALAVYHNAFLSVQLSFNPDDSREMLDEGDVFFYPWWIDWEPLHSCHRANLLRKDYEFYSKHGWVESPVNGYIWPLESPNTWVSTMVGQSLPCNVTQKKGGGYRINDETNWI